MSNFTGRVTIENVLTSTSSSTALSAAQGKTLKDTADTLAITVAGKGSGTVTSVTLTQPAAGLTLTNTGVSQTTAASSTVALANDLAAVEELTTTGIVRRTGTDTWSAGTAVGLTSEVTGVLPVANGGTGVSTAAGTASAFTSRALTNADNSNTLVCGSSQTATVNTGLQTGFGCAFKGTIAFAGTATVTDVRTTGATNPWCALIQTGTNTYDAVGGKA